MIHVRCPGPAWDQWGLASGRCWHSWGGDTVTLTPALITLWRQTDRDRLISWGISAKLGHAKWRSGGLFLFNFNLHLENPNKVLLAFVWWTNNIAIWWFTNILKRVSIKYQQYFNSQWAKACEIESIFDLNQFDPHESQFDRISHQQAPPGHFLLN